MRQRATSGFALLLTTLFLAALAALPEAALAARTWEASVAGVIEGPGGATMNYRYFLPEAYDPNESYPLVLSLHGAGSVGTDNVTNVRWVINDLIARTERDYPAILLSPQIATPGWGPSNPNDLTPRLLDAFLEEFPIDRRRLYLTGGSMGGYGTMRYLQEFHVDNPGRFEFAAAAPTAGAFVSVSAVETLRETPIWLSHNRGDPLVPFSSSLDTYNALTGQPPGTRFTANVRGGGAGGPLAESGLTRLTAYSGTTHNSWGPLYGSNGFYDWMFSQSLTIPEPTTAVLIAVGGTLLSLGSRRCRRRPVEWLGIEWLGTGRVGSTESATRSEHASAACTAGRSPRATRWSARGRRRGLGRPCRSRW